MECAGGCFGCRLASLVRAISFVHVVVRRGQRACACHHALCRTCHFTTLHTRQPRPPPRWGRFYLHPGRDPSLPLHCHHLDPADRWQSLTGEFLPLAPVPPLFAASVFAGPARSSGLPTHHHHRASGIASAPLPSSTPPTHQLLELNMVELPMSWSRKSSTIGTMTNKQTIVNRTYQACEA